ncbi:hypothetical protein EYZ11_013461 [Aspergillus tanneri]|uniref:Uncharacterized protein n=1 Tax=Aspergillus tanneri TaxID=1220188 RepID=A0A4S3IXQ1_9EURO|nr:hypothetical protein EYZ11_013461 [Aspergillus tanneri]
MVHGRGGPEAQVSAGLEPGLALHAARRPRKAVSTIYSNLTMKLELWNPGGAVWKRQELIVAGSGGDVARDLTQVSRSIRNSL